MRLKKKIQGTLNNLTGHWVIYYSKFHFLVNHIEYLWCDSKSYTCKNFTYTIEGLRDIILAFLKNVKHSTILRYYNSCMRKMDD